MTSDMDNANDKARPETIKLATRRLAFGLILVMSVLIAYRLWTRSPAPMCDELPWVLDKGYLRQLIEPHFYNRYEKMSGHSSADTVRFVRVYKVSDETGYRMLTLEELSEEALMLEIRNRDYIRRLVHAAREKASVKLSKDCLGDNRGRTLDKYYVVMFDDAARQAAYFIMQACSGSDGEYVKVVPYELSVPEPDWYPNKALISTGLLADIRRTH